MPPIPDQNLKYRYAIDFGALPNLGRMPIEMMASTNQNPVPAYMQQQSTLTMCIVSTRYDV